MVENKRPDFFCRIYRHKKDKTLELDGKVMGT